jgi:hypothetical protein
VLIEFKSHEDDGNRLRTMTDMHVCTVLKTDFFLVSVENHHSEEICN